MPRLWPSRYSLRRALGPKNTGSSTSTTARSLTIGTTNIRAIPPKVFELKTACPPRKKLDYNPGNRSIRTFARRLTPYPLTFAVNFRLRRPIIGM
jgi:hypothetical protein